MFFVYNIRKNGLICFVVVVGMDGGWMGRKETQLVGVLRKKRSAAQLRARRPMAPGVLFPFRKKTKFRKEKKNGSSASSSSFCFSTERRRRSAYHLYRMAIAIGERENILSRLPPCRDGSPSSKAQEKKGNREQPIPKKVFLKNCFL